MIVGATWTYEEDFTLQRDRVRRLIPDVDSNNPLLSDAEIGMFATDGDGSTLAQDYLAAASLCETLADGMPDIRAETTSAALSFTSDFWLEKAKRLRANAARGVGSGSTGSVPYAGGISITDIDSHLADPDREPMLMEPTRRERTWVWGDGNQRERLGG